jgi:glycosyltransferase involved in cell wall biosynthesis
LKEQRPDVALVHSGWSHSIFGPTIQRARTPLVRWFHAIPDPRNRLDRWSRHTLPSLAICNSEYTAGGVREQDADLPQVVVRPPVTEPPTAAATARSRLRAEFGANDGICVILQAGRMEPGKGHRVLLEALGRLHGRKDWVAWQVGGAQREEELAYLGALGLMAAKFGVASRVRFLGERRDIREIFAAADVYCQPNQVPESFGITFVEALYAGLPVVTSGIGGANEIVDRSCGVLLPPGDAAALAEALQNLIADPALRRSSGSTGPARARLLCDPTARIREMHQALATRTGPRYG